MVIISRERYIAEAYRRRSDTNMCQLGLINVFLDVNEEIKDIQSLLQKSGVIIEDMATYAVPVDSKPIRFTFYQRIIRVVSRKTYFICFGSPIYGFSVLVDHIIQPFVPNIPSCIRDTPDYLDRQHVLCPLPVDSILCTIDVTVIYNSIPHDDGLANLRIALLEFLITTCGINCICDLTELVPKRIAFEFNKEYFIQTSRTAIETKLALGYANLFLAIFERDSLTYANKPSIWLSYIDDIFHNMEFE